MDQMKRYYSRYFVRQADLGFGLSSLPHLPDKELNLVIDSILPLILQPAHGPLSLV